MNPSCTGFDFIPIEHSVSNKNRRSCFVLSLPKAGSTLLNKIMRDLAEITEMKFHSIMDEYFIEGVADQDIPSDAGHLLVPEGHIYGGFRYLPPQLHIPILHSSPRVFLIRDPRDMLVSLFFSVRSSHSLPGENSESCFREKFIIAREKAKFQSVDEFCLENAKGIIELLLSYRNLLDDGLTKIFKYEDVIFNKNIWIRDMASHLGLSVPAVKCDEIAARYDLRVGSEGHVRNIEPGDYLRKLTPATISILNDKLRHVLEAFHYDTGYKYYLDAISLIRQNYNRINSVSLQTIPSEIIPRLKSLPLANDIQSVEIDDGSVCCMEYWIEQDGERKVSVLSRTPFVICYLLNFQRPVQDVLLGISFMNSQTRESDGKNTADLGSLTFEMGQNLLVKWSVSGISEEGLYLTSVGMSSVASPTDFLFRQYCMRSFRIGE